MCIDSDIYNEKMLLVIGTYCQLTSYMYMYAVTLETCCILLVILDTSCS